MSHYTDLYPSFVFVYTGSSPKLVRLAAMQVCRQLAGARDCPHDRPQMVYY